ncbi:MAG: Coenzyme F420 hydrogenase/dehydrogenase, beta subunit C-terminal domain [Betaproteobacteria bacterium]
MRLQSHVDEPAAPVHPIWGPWLCSRTAHAADEQVRQAGSSGGVLSAIAVWLLQTGAVRYVAQVAVSADDPLRNDLQISTTREQVLHAAGSRYAPSAPLAGLAKLLDRGERFAFVGKPCDVAALRRYARHDPRVNQQVVVMLSFMCAGVPSLAGTHELIRSLGGQPDQVRQFRYRGDGWPGMARAVLANGQVLETDYNRSWGQVLNRHLQFRCKICPDGTGESADIVCADAWYGQDGYPDFAERPGRSLLLTRTVRGEALVAQAMAAHALAAQDLPVADIARMQPYQVLRKQVVLGRWLATWVALRFAPRYRHLGLLRASLQSNKIEWLRNAWGTLRRAHVEEL